MKSNYFDHDVSLGSMLELYYELKDSGKFENSEQEEWFVEFDEFMGELGNPQRLQQVGD